MERLDYAHFSLLTLTFAEIIHKIVFEWYGVTKGDDGISGMLYPRRVFSMDYSKLIEAAMLRNGED